MKGSKLSEILSSIPQKEWRELKEYVSSPFFNKNRHLVDLLDVIYKALFYQKKEFPTKKYVWGKLFSDEPFKEQRLFILMSKLDKLCSDYINYQYFKQNDLTYQMFMLRASLSRRIPKHFKQTFKNTEDNLEKQLKKNPKYHYHDYFLRQDYLLRVEEDFDHHQNARKRNVIGVIQSLDNYYLVTKLRYLCIFLNRKDLLQVEEQTEINAFLDYLDQFDLSKLVILRMYQLTLLTLMNPEIEGNYHTLKALLNEHQNNLSKQEKEEFYLYLQNYLIKKLNAGKVMYRDLFLLYQDMLENVLLIKGGSLNLQYFKNIVTTALRLEEFEWVQKFIVENYKKLPKADQDDAFCYNMGNMYFYQQKFHEAMINLLQVKSRNLSYYLGAKSILLKSYYELGEQEALFSLTHSFGIYIRRNKIMSDSSKRNYLNMVKFFKRLSKLPKGNLKKAERLLEKLNETSHVMEKQWLLRKIRELS